MATQKRVCLIHELGDFANTWFRKVNKFQGDGLSRFGVLSHLMGWKWKAPPPGAYKVVQCIYIKTIDKFSIANIKDG